MESVNPLLVDVGAKILIHRDDRDTYTVILHNRPHHRFPGHFGGPAPRARRAANFFFQPLDFALPQLCLSFFFSYASHNLQIVALPLTADPLTIRFGKATSIRIRHQQWPLHRWPRGR